MCLPYFELVISSPVRPYESVFDVGDFGENELHKQAADFQNCDWNRLPRFHAYFRSVYSCGLRLNEALALQVRDIDAERMRIHVHRGKGVKDRFVRPEATLSPQRREGATDAAMAWQVFFGNVSN